MIVTCCAKMEISVLIDDCVQVSLVANRLQSLVQQVLVAQGVDSNAELGLVVTGQQKMQELNRGYLGKDAPTDVLAFSMLPAEDTPEAESPLFVNPPDEMWHLGEVIVSYHQAVVQAEEHHHSLEREMAILITHGVLHLLGYEDSKPELRCIMAEREAEILFCLDVE